MTCLHDANADRLDELDARISDLEDVLADPDLETSLGNDVYLQSFKSGWFIRSDAYASFIQENGSWAKGVWFTAFLAPPNTGIVSAAFRSDYHGEFAVSVALYSDTSTGYPFELVADASIEVPADGGSGKREFVIPTDFTTGEGYLHWWAVMPVRADADDFLNITRQESPPNALWSFQPSWIQGAFLLGRSLLIETASSFPIEVPTSGVLQHFQAPVCVLELA